MTNAIGFAVRDSAGRTQTGTVAGEGQSNAIRVGSGESVSLNLGQASIVSYEKQGGDLLIKLTDGRVILLTGYFDGSANQLYLSTNGEIVEVMVTGSGEGVLFANYGQVESWGKWSPLDDLRFTGGDPVGSYAMASEDPAGMAALVPGLLAGAGGLGTAAAIAGGAVVLGAVSGGGDSGSGGEEPVPVDPVPVDPVPVDPVPVDPVPVDPTPVDPTPVDPPPMDPTPVDPVPVDPVPVDPTPVDPPPVTPTPVDPTPVTPTPLPPTPVRATPTVDPQAPAPLTTNTADPRIVVTGTGEPGDSVRVTVGTQTQTTTITTQGTWTATFPSTGLPADGTHTATVVVTQPGGITTSLTGPVFVLDMTPPAVAVTQGTQSVGDVENAVEYQNGVTMSGTGEPGASISVQVGTATQTTTVSSTGTWTVTFPTSQIATGEYTVPARVTATDALGNRTVLNEVMVIDTVPHPIAVAPVTTDNIVNFVESQAGLVVGGTSTAGAILSVTVQGVTQTATVASNGSWSVTYPTGTLPGGEYNATVVATTTDAAGNPSSTTHNFQVDTLVRNFATIGGAIGGDGVVNGAEAAAGITLAGTVEPGSTVVVRLSSGAQHTVTAGSDGTWTATFRSSEIPRGEMGQTVTITATDRVGNTATISRAFEIDTIAPGAPDVVSFGRDSTGLRNIGTESTTDTYTFSKIDTAGVTTAVPTIRTEDTVYDETNFRFTTPVPDGSYLVVDTRDTAGNESSTLLIVNNTSAPTVDLSRAGLSAFDFTAIDLTFAPDAQLSITAQQLASLTGPTGELVVKGDADDTVTLVGGTDTGRVQTIDGQAYKLYTLGTGTSVLIDDDIQTNTSVV